LGGAGPERWRSRGRPGSGPAGGCGGGVAPPGRLVRRPAPRHHRGHRVPLPM